MNVTDLQDELDSRADAATGPAATGSFTPLTGAQRTSAVHRRIALRHRRRVVGGAVLALTLAALVGGVLPRLNVTGDVSLPAAPDFVLDPITFVPADADDPLVASVVGEAGQSEVTLRFIPDGTNLHLVDSCRFLDGVLRDQLITTVISVNGKDRPQTGQCSLASTPSEPNGGPFDIEDELIRAGWAADGARPGETLEIRIRAVDELGSPFQDPAVQLGLGVYSRDGERLTVLDQVVRTRFTQDGVSYRLFHAPTKLMADGRAQVTFTVPAGTAPGIVLWGSNLTGLTRLEGSGDLLVDGAPASQSHGELGGSSIATMPDPKQHTVTVRARTDEKLRPGQSAAVLAVVYLAE